MINKIIENYRLELNPLFELDNDLNNNSNHTYAYDSQILNLNNLLSNIHGKINKLFEELNNRSSRSTNDGRRLLAQDSRDLLTLINKTEEMLRALNDNGCYIELVDEYRIHMAYCNTFLSDRYGSVIPEEYTKISLITYSPIFKFKDPIFGNVKNLVFLAAKNKPDITIKDLLDGNLSIENSKDILVYDREIGKSLLYKEFNEWLNEKYPEGKDLPINNLNTIEKKVADYYKVHYKKDLSPVLIPQVYLHYDPKNKAFRENYNKGQIYKFQRMDFLILFAGKRIIIEIDGKTHTPENSLIEYSKQLKYDRDMKFLGYEVFRLGGYELTNDFDNVVREFFDKLFYYLGVE